MESYEPAPDVHAKRGVQARAASTESGSETPSMIVAAIGASAGGIQALQAFFQALPSEPGAAFVVVIHLSPEHRSLLPAIIAAKSTMLVEPVTRTMPLEENRVYVIPPDRRLEITHGDITSLPFDEPRGHRAPIDLLFHSLAEMQGNGFAVVLSGGGSDGAAGVKSVKAAGGLVLVQDPSEAAHDSMPRAAIATGTADLVMPVRELAAAVAELARAQGRIRETSDASAPSRIGETGDTALGRALADLRVRASRSEST